MKNHLINLLICLLVLIASAGFAQNDNFSLEGILGEDMTMTFDGTYEFSYNTVTGQMDEFKVKKNVVLRSESIDLDCQNLIYDAVKNRIIAEGWPVQLRQESVNAECQRLEYYPEIGKSILTGNPVIRQKDADGSGGLDIGGETITLFRKDGKLRMLVEAGEDGGEMTTEGGRKRTSAGNGTPAELVIPPEMLEQGSAGATIGDSAPDTDEAASEADTDTGANQDAPRRIRRQGPSKMPAVSE